MNSPLIILTLASVFIPGGLMAQQAPAFRQVPLDQVPAIVRETLMKAAGKGKVESIREVTGDKAVQYRADIDLADDTDVKLHVNPDGAVIKTITEVRRENVPAGILATCTTVANGNGKVEDIEQVIAAGVTTWQAEIDREGQADLEVTLDAAGSVLRQQEETK
jgi:uncharacterized protein YxeA